MSKVYLLKLIVCDWNNEMMNAEEITHVIENARYPNRCINPQVLSDTQFVEVGDFEDDHEWNDNTKVEVLTQKLFSVSLRDNIPLDVVTDDGKTITVEYSSDTKHLVVKTGANTLKSRLL